jgi:CheY-like chemotaxis protein
MILKGLTQHTIVLCVDKRERAIVLETVLRRAGYNVVSTFGLYEALRVVAQEMPHLIISDSILIDGTIASLYDRLLQHPFLKSCPIMALVNKKIRSHITPLTGRSFAGFILGAFNAETFLAKVSDILTSRGSVSPFFKRLADYNIDDDAVLSVKASPIGIYENHAVFESKSEISSCAAVVCLPKTANKAPAMLKGGTNHTIQDKIYNLFPLTHIQGKGKAWIMNLPNVDLFRTDNKSGKNIDMIFCDPDANRGEQFSKILKGYNVNSQYVSSIQSAVSLIERNPDNLDAIYLYELTSGTSSILLREAWGKIPLEKRPPLIVGTSSSVMRSTTQIFYIKKPFGLGTFVEKVSIAAKTKGPSAPVREQPNEEVTFHAKGKVLGIDESGGILMARFPMVKGSQMYLEHAFLKDVWEANTLIEVDASAPSPTEPNVWQLRFHLVQSAKMSKERIWQTFTKALEGRKPPEGKSA